jgi:transcriptional regulator with XRE-family HTH domain
MDQPTSEIAAIGERMKAVRNHLGLTQADFAKLVGASKPGIQDNESGKNMPGGKVLKGLSANGVNTNWLLTGEGPMLLADLDQEAPPVDMERLKMAMQALELALKKSHKILDAERKARAVTVLYEYFTKAGPQDQATVDRMVDLMI